MELLGQFRGFMRLCIIYKLIQFGLRILRCCLAGGLHIIQTAQDITDPVSGVLHLCFRLLDAVKHHPVDKQAVKKVIRKAQETIHLCLYIRVDGHVAQLGAEAAELDLQCFDLVLCAVQMAVLGKVGNQPAAEQIERTPAAGTVQARKNAVRRAAGAAGAS